MQKASRWEMNEWMNEEKVDLPSLINEQSLETPADSTMVQSGRKKTFW